MTADTLPQVPPYYSVGAPSRAPVLRAAQRHNRLACRCTIAAMSPRRDACHAQVRFSLRPSQPALQQLTHHLMFLQPPSLLFSPQPCLAASHATYRCRSSLAHCAGSANPCFSCIVAAVHSHVAAHAHKLTLSTVSQQLQHLALCADQVRSAARATHIPAALQPPHTIARSGVHALSTRASATARTARTRASRTAVC